MIKINENGEVVIVAGEMPDYGDILQDDRKLGAFMAYLRQKGFEGGGSVGTPSGRKDIKSRAYAVARHKTALDDAGKALGEDARKKVEAINEKRRFIKSKLEELQDEISKPVEDWEKQEKARFDSVQAVLSRIDALSSLALDITSAEVDARIAELSRIEIEHSTFQEMWDAAVTNRDRAVAMLTAAADRLRRAEADKAELDRLRLEADQRAARDEADRVKAEASKIESERAETARLHAEAVAARAAEDIKREADARAAAAVADEQRKAAEALAEQDRAHKAAIERIRLEAEAKELAERQARDVDAARMADQEHRGRVMESAALEIVNRTLAPHKLASEIINLIAHGHIPGVSIKF